LIVFGLPYSDRDLDSFPGTPFSRPESISDRVKPNTPESFNRFPKLMFFSPRSGEA